MTQSPKLLIIGRAGQLASDLAEASARDHRVATVLGRPDLDLTDASSIERAIVRVKPDAVINAAAYTAVDKAETERDLAFAVNGIGPGHLAALCANAGIPIIHVSTDMVFPDRAEGEHREDDPVAPLSHYGVTKLEGEKRVAGAGGRHLIARVSWVFSPAGDNFVKKVLEWAKTRQELNIVADQRGRPTYSPGLARALLELASRMVADSRDTPQGLLHLAGDDVMCRDEQARRVMAESARRGGPSARIIPVPTTAFPTPATRALNAVLDVERAQNQYGIQLGRFDEDLSAMLDQLIGKPGEH